jgi:hypothetical protein
MALDEFQALDADHEELSAFLDVAEYHRAVVVTIIQHRRDAIEASCRPSSLGSSGAIASYPWRNRSPQQRATR